MTEVPLTPEIQRARPSKYIAIPTQALTNDVAAGSPNGVPACTALQGDSQSKAPLQQANFHSQLDDAQLFSTKSFDDPQHAVEALSKSPTFQFSTVSVVTFGENPTCPISRHRKSSIHSLDEMCLFGNATCLHTKRRSKRCNSDSTEAKKFKKRPPWDNLYDDEPLKRRRNSDLLCLFAPFRKSKDASPIREQKTTNQMKIPESILLSPAEELPVEHEAIPPRTTPRRNVKPMHTFCLQVQVGNESLRNVSGNSSLSHSFSRRIKNSSVERRKARTDSGIMSNYSLVSTEAHSSPILNDQNHLSARASPIRISSSSPSCADWSHASKAEVDSRHALLGEENHKSVSPANSVSSIEERHIPSLNERLQFADDRRSSINVRSVSTERQNANEPFIRPGIAPLKQSSPIGRIGDPVQQTMPSAQPIHSTIPSISIDTQSANQHSRRPELSTFKQISPIRPTFDDLQRSSVSTVHDESQQSFEKVHTLDENVPQSTAQNQSVSPFSSSQILHNSSPIKTDMESLQQSSLPDSSGFVDGSMLSKEDQKSRTRNHTGDTLDDEMLISGDIHPSQTEVVHSLPHLIDGNYTWPRRCVLDGGGLQGYLETDIDQFDQQKVVPKSTQGQFSGVSAEKRQLCHKKGGKVVNSAVSNMMDEDVNRIAQDYVRGLLKTSSTETLHLIRSACKSYDRLPGYGLPITVGRAEIKQQSPDLDYAMQEASESSDFPQALRKSFPHFAVAVLNLSTAYIPRYLSTIYDLSVASIARKKLTTSNPDLRLERMTKTAQEAVIDHPVGIPTLLVAATVVSPVLRQFPLTLISYGGATNAIRAAITEPGSFFSDRFLDLVGVFQATPTWLTFSVVGSAGTHWRYVRPSS